MEWDDIVYLALLFSCIGFGHIFKNIRSKEVKKWTATIVGFLIVFIASGRHIFHPLLCMTVNAVIIKCGNKR